jgi:hypothetical protein
MKNNNKSDYTIRFVRKSLTYIANRTNINNPEAVKALIASMKASDGYKKNLCTAYKHLLQTVQNRMEQTTIQARSETHPHPD